MPGCGVGGNRRRGFMVSSCSKSAIKCMSVRPAVVGLGRSVSGNKCTLARGLPYMTSAKLSDFLTPSPPCHVQKSADFVPFVCFLGTPSQSGRHIWKGSPILTSAKFWDFLTTSPPCNIQKSADFVPFVCFLETPSQSGRHIWKPLYEIQSTTS